jgi:hypothetical protein
MSLFSGKGRMKFAQIAACAAVLSFGASANAGLTIIDLGGGWQAEFDNALNPLVDVNPFKVNTALSAVFIQKSAEFTSLAPINIVFRQISANAVSNIVIDDEIITNSSGVHWTDFHMAVTGAANVAFDPVATAASGGFSVAPFGGSNFTNGNTEFNAFGGAGIPNGGLWFPGVVSGQLWIHANLGPTFTTFTLVENPTIPAPGALALLGVAGLFTAGRRRRC